MMSAPLSSGWKINPQAFSPTGLERFETSVSLETPPGGGSNPCEHQDSVALQEPSAVETDQSRDLENSLLPWFPEPEHGQLQPVQLDPPGRAFRHPLASCTEGKDK